MNVLYISGIIFLIYAVAAGFPLLMIKFHNKARLFLERKQIAILSRIFTTYEDIRLYLWYVIISGIILFPGYLYLFPNTKTMIDSKVKTEVSINLPPKNTSNKK